MLHLEQSSPSGTQNCFGKNNVIKTFNCSCVEFYLPFCYRCLFLFNIRQYIKFPGFLFLSLNL